MGLVARTVRSIFSSATTPLIAHGRSGLPGNSKTAAIRPCCRRGTSGPARISCAPCSTSRRPSGRSRSPDYLQALYTQPEWAAAFAQDPTGEKGLLIPVRVGTGDATGLLPQIVYIDLVGLDEETARHALQVGVARTRAKPTEPPVFPGVEPLRPSQPPQFPGSVDEAEEGAPSSGPQGWEEGTVGDISTPDAPGLPRQVVDDLLPRT